LIGFTYFYQTMKRLLVLLFLINLTCHGQYEPLARNAFMHPAIQEAFDYWSISKPNTTFHSSFKPYLSSTFSNATDSVVPFRFYAFKNFFLSKTYNESPQNRNWFNLQLHPIVDLEPGYDLLNQKFITSLMGGTHFKININNDFTFAATLVGGNNQYPFFLDTTLSSNKIIPEYGQGYRSTNSSYSFFDYNGYISYSPKNNKVFNFQLGRDKHFIGDGYRSVMLSDFAASYPYFRINANIWRLQYSVWYSWMYDVTASAGLKNNFRNKYGTFHYLSYNIVKGLNVGVFENIVWRGTDTNQARTFEVNYLNPVILYRPAEYSVGSPDNSFLGLNLNGVLFNRIKLYGQLGLDEFYLKEIRARRGWWANKQAWQLGAKYINALGIKGLKLQVEYNQVRPYTYTHGLVDQNYSHYGKPLAHPFGANFKECLGFITYRKNNWELSCQGMYAIIGKDSSGTKSNVGQNIFLSYTTRPFEYGHYTTQGIKTTVLQSQLKFTYYIIPDMNLRLELGYIQRSEKNIKGYILENPYFFVGFKSSFWNIYRDF
jgi:hypothetical protein